MIYVQRMCRTAVGICTMKRTCGYIVHAYYTWLFHNINIPNDRDQISNMSVHLKAFAKGVDLSKIKLFLFGSDDVQGGYRNDPYLLIISLSFSYTYLAVYFFSWYTQWHRKLCIPRWWNHSVWTHWQNYNIYMYAPVPVLILIET